MTFQGYKTRLGVFALLVTSVAGLGAQVQVSPPKAPGIKRCVNAIGLIDEADNEWPETLANIRSAGFGTVRIQISPPYGPGVKRASTISYVKRVANIADYASREGFQVILDMRGGASLYKSKEDFEHFSDMWTLSSPILSRLNPDRIYFEIMNEPHGFIDKRNFKSITIALIDNIRKADPSRTFVVGTYWYSNVAGLKDWKSFPLLSGVIPSFHFYDPMSFTHQGAHWLPRYSKVRTHYDPKVVSVALNNAISVASDFRDSTGVNPLVGEIGAIVSPPRAERTAYLNHVERRLSAAGFASCLWGWSRKPQMFSINEGPDIFPELSKWRTRTEAIPKF